MTEKLYDHSLDTASPGALTGDVYCGQCKHSWTAHAIDGSRTDIHGDNGYCAQCTSSHFAPPCGWLREGVLISEIVRLTASVQAKSRVEITDDEVEKACESYHVNGLNFDAWQYLRRDQSAWIVGERLRMRAAMEAALNG